MNESTTTTAQAPEQRAITEINAGVYVFDAAHLRTALATLVFAINLAGDGLRDMLDPHMRTRRA